MQQNLCIVLKTCFSHEFFQSLFLARWGQLSVLSSFLMKLHSKSCFTLFLWLEAVAQRSSVKTVLLKISQNSLENTSAGVSGPGAEAFWPWSLRARGSATLLESNETLKKVFVKELGYFCVFFRYCLLGSNSHFANYIFKHITYNIKI